MHKIKSALGVLILLVGCSMILWPGVFTTSALGDTESRSETSPEELLAALGMGESAVGELAGEPSLFGGDAGDEAPATDPRENETVSVPADTGHADSEIGEVTDAD